MLKKLLLIFIPIAISLVAIFFYYNLQVKEEKLYNIMDQLRLTLDVELKEHKMSDLQTAILLANNSALVDALENDDEDLGYTILSQTLKKVKQNTHRIIRAQVFTKELNILARSWDDVYAGMPIGDYRTDLQYFNTHTTPRVSIEVGRLLGIKATVPIYKENELLGFLEVISFFKDITDFFSIMGVDLYVLLDVKHADSAVLMTENLMVQNYVISNTAHNSSHVQTLRSINFKELRLSGFIQKNGKYFFYDNMHDGEGTIIGNFIFVLPQKYLDYFRDPEDDISFLINITKSSLYEIVKEEQFTKNIYEEFDASEFIYLKDVIDKKDKEIFMQKAYEKFDAYSKDELIQMMLRKKVVKKIDGKIK